MPNTVTLLTVIAACAATIAFPDEEFYEKIPEHLNLGEDRNFEVHPYTRWPNGRVPYIITGNYDEEYLNKIHIAFNSISQVSCVTFVPRTDEIAYLNVTDEGGPQCRADLGYQGGQTKMRVNNCGLPGIIHESFHTLGFAHEHNRPDRDDYVHIFWERIQQDLSSSFFKNEWGTTPEDERLEACVRKSGIGPSEDYSNCSTGFQYDACGLPYDYFSILHYGKTTSRVSGVTGNTMEAKHNSTMKIGMTDNMTELDIKKLNCAYGCDHGGAHISGTCGKISSRVGSHSFNWRIKAEDEKCFIELSFSKFSTGGDCSSDFVNVYNGRRSGTPSQTFCQGKEPTIYQSGTDSLYIDLQRSNEDTEFEACWRQVCSPVPECCPSFELLNTRVDGNYTYTPGNEKNGQPIYVGPYNITFKVPDSPNYFYPTPWMTTPYKQSFGIEGYQGGEFCFSDITKCSGGTNPWGCPEGPQVTCTAVCDCDPPTAPSGVEMTWNESRKYGTVATYTDANGARSYSKCGMDGTWTTPGCCSE